MEDQIILLSKKVEKLSKFIHILDGSIRELKFTIEDLESKIKRLS